MLFEKKNQIKIHPFYVVFFQEMLANHGMFVFLYMPMEVKARATVNPSC